MITATWNSFIVQSVHKIYHIIESIIEFENSPKAVISAKPGDVGPVKITDDVKNQNISITGCP